MNVSVNRIVNQLFGLLLGLNEHSMSILIVRKMKIMSFMLSCQIYGLMAISLLTIYHWAMIYFPWLISIPYCPMSVCDLEFLLKSFSEPPFHRLINDCKSVVTSLQLQILQLKYSLVVFFSHYLNNWVWLWVYLVLWVTSWQEGVYIFLELRRMNRLTMNWKSGRFIELEMPS